MEILFSHASLVLSRTLVGCPDATVRFDSRATIGSDDDAVFLTATGGDPTDVVAELDADPTVADFLLVATFEDESLFRVRPADDAFRVLPSLDEVGAAVRSARGSDGCWSVTCYLPDRVALTALVEFGQEADASVTVQRLSDLRRSDSSDPARLTPEQRDLLATAREHGYFETPRGISQRELAAKFGVSPSAISQRLRTATGELTAHLSG